MEIRKIKMLTKVNLSCFRVFYAIILRNVRL